MEKINVILADDTGGVIDVLPLSPEPWGKIELSEDVSEVIIALSVE